MLVWPSRRRRLIAVERRVAITRDPFPVRVWDRSSSMATSRTQCTRFSIPQCPWIHAASVRGGASCVAAVSEMAWLVVPRVEEPGLSERFRVVDAAGQRIGDPGELTVERARDLHGDAGSPMFPEVQFWTVPP